MLSTAAWLGLVTGLIEGCGLLLFQTLNREGWALHVSAPIIWISTLVDLVLFCALALLVAGISHFFRKFSAVRGTAVLLTGLATYDFLTLSARLTSRSRILLALGVAVAFRRWILKHETVAVRFWRRTLPWAATAGLLALVGIPGARWLREHRALAQLPSAAPNAPNVLVIVVDTLRADHLSSYGYSRPTSPNIDRLAREGVLFDNAVSSCSWTYPSHVSLITGRYLFEHGAGQPETIPLFARNKSSFGGYPTIGEVLERSGYRTGAFSANRFFFIGNAGFDRGFIHFEDYYYSTADMVARTLPGKELLRLYGKWFSKRLTVEWLAYGTNYGIRKRGDEVNRELLRWIDQGGRRPFFAFLNYLDVHDPYGAPGSQLKVPGNLRDVDAYDNGVQYADDSIGRLVHGLEQRGLDKNTLVIVTSDHGESLGEHGITGHGQSLYWNLIHVPLVLWFPDHIPSGVRISTPVSNVAIPATIMRLLGAAEDTWFPGPALNLLWHKPEMAANWPATVSEIAQGQTTFKADAALERRVATARAGPLKSLVTSRWHLIIHKKFGNQLYDWVTDPAETKNLASTPAGDRIAGDLISRLNDALTGVSGRGPQPEATVLDNGTFHARTSPIKVGHEPRLNDYYRVRAAIGSKVTIEVESTSSKQLDPVIGIEDASGKLYQSCRNPGDDHIPPPGIPDPTPDAFDDLCVNDDNIPGLNTNSKLEILVPGQPGPAVDLYVRVTDWNGYTPASANYQIAVSGAENSSLNNSAPQSGH